MWGLVKNILTTDIILSNSLRLIGVYYIGSFYNLSKEYYILKIKLKQEEKKKGD